MTEHNFKLSHPATSNPMMASVLTEHTTCHRTQLCNQFKPLRNWIPTAATHNHRCWCNC